MNKQLDAITQGIDEAIENPNIIAEINEKIDELSCLLVALRAQGNTLEDQGEFDDLMMDNFHNAKIATWCHIRGDLLDFLME